jgi:hypothetical protein
MPKTGKKVVKRSDTRQMELKMKNSAVRAARKPKIDRARGRVS